ncbi:MAG: C_GCAxxG_C_C family protein [Oscillospiraceae bacterium]|nr:C_GCAxxG_C_C family protein [Oscillospiraceae bacterium]
MESRIEVARGRFHNGYNCSQTVMCTYCDLLNLSPEDGYRMSEGFGGGIAQTRGICGTVTALVMLAGLKRSDALPGKGVTKMDTYALIQPMLKEFEEQNGSLLCSELKGLTGGPVLRDCKACVADAAALAEKYIFPDLFQGDEA